MFFAIRNIREDLQKVQQESLAPGITPRWLSDRLDRAPSKESMARYLFRDRHFPLSINAQERMKSCGTSHDRALQILRGGASSQEELETTVHSAIAAMQLAWQKFDEVAENISDFNRCLGDCECLMNTTCLLLIMFTSTKEWATKCMIMMRRGGLSLKDIAPIPLQENFDDADKACRSFLREYKMAMDETIKREELSMRSNTVRGKGKEPARVLRPQIQCEALQTPPRVYNNSEPPVQQVYPFGAEYLQPMWITSMAASPLLGYDIPASIGADSSIYYSPSSYSFSRNSLPLVPFTPTSGAPRSTSSRSKRRLSVDDELDQRPAQRRRETLSDPTSVSTAASNVPIFPQFLPLGLSTPQDPDLGIFNCPDYFPWDPETSRGGFNVIPSGYQEDSVVRPLMAHSSGGFS